MEPKVSITMKMGQTIRYKYFSVKFITVTELVDEAMRILDVKVLLSVFNIKQML